MPINRPDGRHWCDPASETPGPDGTWTCECKQVWTCQLGTWVRAEDLDDYRVLQSETATINELNAAEEQD